MRKMDAVFVHCAGTNVKSSLGSQKRVSRFKESIEVYGDGVRCEGELSGFVGKATK